MTKKCKCSNCGMSFNSKTEKKNHKKEYPNESCKGKFSNKEVMASERDKSFELSIPEANYISMPQEQAKQELKIYREMLKTRKESYLKEMKESLVQLAKGKKLININEVMKKAGVREDGFPKLAIARADLRKVYLHRNENGRASFSQDSRGWNMYKKNTIWLPVDTFKEFIRTEQERHSFQVYEALVPIIPAVLMPKGNLENYWILWEVDKWSKTPLPPKDPILLKRINETTFVILAVWDLTDLERNIIGGRK